MQPTNISCQTAQVAVLTDLFRGQTSKLQGFYLILTSTGDTSVNFPESCILSLSRVLEDTLLSPEVLSTLHRLAVAMLPADFDPRTIILKVSNFYKGAITYEPDVSELDEEGKNAVKVYEAFLMVMERMERCRRVFADAVVAKFDLREEYREGGEVDALKLLLARAVYEPVEEGKQLTKVQRVLDSSYEYYTSAEVVQYFPESEVVDFFKRGHDGRIRSESLDLGDWEGI